MAGVSENIWRSNITPSLSGALMGAVYVGYGMGAKNADTSMFSLTYTTADWARYCCAIYFPIRRPYSLMNISIRLCLAVSRPENSAKPSCEQTQKRFHVRISLRRNTDGTRRP